MTSSILHIKRYFGGDYKVWIILLILFVVSIVEVYSSTDSLAYRSHGGDTEYYLFKHVALISLSFFMAWLTHLIKPSHYKPFVTILFMVCVTWLLFTLFNGVEVNNAKRWSYFLGLRLQPSDMIKIPMVLFASVWLARHQKSKYSSSLSYFLRGILPLVCLIGIATLLILPENLSTAILFALTGLTMLVLGNVSFKYLFLLLSFSVVILLGSIYILHKVNPDSRVTTWIHRLSTFAGSEESFQATQAKIAVANGVLWGKAPGGSTQRLNLPLAYSDFIYANIIEELGIFGGALVLFMYIWLLFRVRIFVLKCRNPYYVYLSAGLVVMISLQAFLHMMISVGLAPVTGQPLPFVSMGGSSIVVFGIAIGIIQSVMRLENDHSHEVE